MSPEQLLSALGRQIATDPKIHETLWWAALRQARNDEADADDLYQEMVTKALEEEASGAWSPGGEVTGYKLCSRKLANVAGNWRRGARWQVARRAGEEEAEKVPSASPLADEVMHDRQVVEAVRADLRGRGPSGVIPLAMLDCAEKKGIEDHQELADEIGCTLEEIRNARRRLTEAVLRVMGRKRGGSS